MLKTVDFWPRRNAEDFAFTPRHAVVSITDHGQVPARISGTSTILRLQFFDLKNDIGDTRFPPHHLFDASKAHALRDFVSTVQNAPDIDTCIVHCEAGVSRSAAVALVVEALTGAAFPTRESAAFANSRVLQVCSAELGLQIQVPEAQKHGSILLFGRPPSQQ